MHAAKGNHVTFAKSGFSVVLAFCSGIAVAAVENLEVLLVVAVILL